MYIHSVISLLTTIKFLIYSGIKGVPAIGSPVKTSSMLLYKLMTSSLIPITLPSCSSTSPIAIPPPEFHVLTDLINSKSVNSVFTIHTLIFKLLNIRHQMLNCSCPAGAYVCVKWTPLSRQFFIEFKRVSSLLQLIGAVLSHFFI
jgi:hypothetical protein